MSGLVPRRTAGRPVEPRSSVPIGRTRQPSARRAARKLEAAGGRSWLEPPAGPEKGGCYCCAGAVVAGGVVGVVEAAGGVVVVAAGGGASAPPNRPKM